MLIMVVKDYTDLYPYVPDRKFIWPALIAAGASLIGGIIGNSVNNKNNKANRDINQAQIDASEKRLKDEQEYNNFLLNNQKQMQMQDARKSGVNPAYAQGSQISGMSSSPSVPVPSQIPMSPYDWANPLTSAGSNYLNGMLTKAEVRKKTAESELTEAQKDRQLIENEYLPKLMKSQVDLNTSNVKLIGENVHLTHKQADKVSTEVLAINKQMQQIDAQIAELNSRVSVLNQEEKIKAATAAFQSDLMQAQIRDLQAKYKFTEEQTKYYAAQALASIFNTNADTVLKGAQTKNVQSDTTLKNVQVEYTSQQTVESKAKVSNIAADTNLKHVQKEQVYWNAQQNKLDFELDKDFKRTERNLGVAKMTADIAVSATQAAKNAVDIVKPF